MLAHLINRAVAVLDGPQNAEALEAFPLEVQNHVHDVFQHPRARYVALLGHMAHHKDGHVEPLGLVQQGRGALPHLHHVTMTQHLKSGSEVASHRERGEWLLESLVKGWLGCMTQCKDRQLEALGLVEQGCGATRSPAPQHAHRGWGVEQHAVDARRV